MNNRKEIIGFVEETYDFLFEGRFGEIVDQTRMPDQLLVGWFVQAKIFEKAVDSRVGYDKKDLSVISHMIKAVYSEAVVRRRYGGDSDYGSPDILMEENNVSSEKYMVAASRILEIYESVMEEVIDKSDYVG